ncbi:hypothetical protein Mpsy_3002 [Methanolobus psychrophilus R15]|nr:hypothetical protein Mpsy_3002 [Methanolobus psychrophilus R15]
MKKPLLDVIFASEKRKNFILLLKDGPQEMGYLLKSLDTNRQALLPQIRVLEEHHLVSHDRDTYELTTIGKLVVDRMTPVLYTIDALDADIDDRSSTAKKIILFSSWKSNTILYFPPRYL